MMRTILDKVETVNIKFPFGDAAYLNNAKHRLGREFANANQIIDKRIIENPVR